MTKEQLCILLLTTYQQGFNNGFCDCNEGLENNSCAEDWLEECLADGEIAEVKIPDLDLLPNLEDKCRQICKDFSTDKWDVLKAVRDATKEQ